MSNQKSTKYVLTLVFISLLIDLFAFTLILPIYPAMIDYYLTVDKTSTVLQYVNGYIQSFEDLLSNHINMSSNKLRVTLIGGLLGSTFSFFQFIVAPFWGKLGDKVGRKTVLLISIIGNLVSNLLWMTSKNFDLFVLSRLIGGLTEANVQLSNAIISDVTDQTTRSKGMALVGIAFSVAFTVGPSICGYLIFKGVKVPHLSLLGYETPYSFAGLLASSLIIIEFIMLAFLLPETLNYSKPSTKKDESTKSKELPAPVTDFTSSIKQLNIVHLFYLFLFSGMEFTLPFLAHDLFKFNEMEQGKMFGLMGIISSLIQGGYVRRFASKRGEKKLVLEGLFAGVLGLLSLAVFIPQHTNPSNYIIWTAIAFLSYTSATVISCLTALLSLIADNSLKHYQTKATVLGNFRSYGQLGRCLGPVVACSIYWLAGPKVLYYWGSLGMVATYLVLFKMPNYSYKVAKSE